MTDDDAELDGITPRSHDLARLIAAGKTYKAAGRAVGVSEPTVVRAMRDPAMRAWVDRYRTENVDAVLCANLPEARASIEYLARVRDDEHAADYLRVRAATELLANVSRLGRHVADPPPLSEAEALLILRDRVRRAGLE